MLTESNNVNGIYLNRNCDGNCKNGERESLRGRGMHRNMCGYDLRKLNPHLPKKKVSG